MITAVTFDLWNTLLQDKHYTAPRLHATADALHNHGAPRGPEEIREAYRSAARAYRREWEEDHSHMTVDARIRHMLQKLEVEPGEELTSEMAARFEACFLEDPPELKEGAEKTLETLSGRYRLGIISDTGVTPGSIIREYLDTKNLLRHFESTVFSDETGRCKPHPHQFRLALRDLDAQPHEAIHVGDLLRTDVAGDQAIGMKAVWVKTDEETAPEHAAPDYTVTRLDQVLEIPELRTHEAAHGGVK